MLWKEKAEDEDDRETEVGKRGEVKEIKMHEQRKKKQEEYK